MDVFRERKFRQPGKEIDLSSVVSQQGHIEGIRAWRGKLQRIRMVRRAMFFIRERIVNKDAGVNILG